MKKFLKSIAVLALALVMLAGMTATTFASSVTYKGQAESFIFAPGSEYSLTDLFTNYKGVMPGDSLKQNITVKNDASNDVKVKIYMRALGATDLQNPEDGIAEVSAQESKDFLEHMTLTVVQEGEGALFDAPADQTAQLTDWVCLGTFYSGADVNLAVTLNVPIEMGNDCQQQIGALDWEFMVEEFPIEKDEDIPESDKETKTGDDTNVILPILVLLVSGAIIAIILVDRRRRKA